MTAKPSELQPEEAARLLAWLYDMGADEIHCEKAIDRFADAAQQKARTRPAAATVATPASVAPQQVSSAEEIVALVQKAASLPALVELLERFDAHPLKKTATRQCFLGGAQASRILVISDRPRNEEDRSGQVFAGKNEVLVERMLAAIGLCGARPESDCEQAMLASFIPWRPPGNRTPTELECRLSLPFVKRTIEIARPRIILSLGHLAGQWLAGAADSIARQRGKWIDVTAGDLTAPLISTFHPETLLKSPSSKRLAWHDLLALRQRLENLE